MTVWVIEVGEYEQRQICGVAANLDDCVQRAKEFYSHPAIQNLQVTIDRNEPGEVHIGGSYIDMRVRNGYHYDVDFDCTEYDVYSDS